MEFNSTSNPSYLRFNFTTAGEIITDISTSIPSSPPPFAPNPEIERSNSYSSPFKPSIAVIVGLLTTIFFLTFLLLLYAKHCKRQNNSHRSVYGGETTGERKTSGIDRAVIGSLPVFRFASLRRPKDGFECAVCLERFEAGEVLRLLPKCKHAFHVECLDTWLDAHSTCPLCRYRVHPEDVLLVENDARFRGCDRSSPPEDVSIGVGSDCNSGVRRVSGRHSSAGEIDRCEWRNSHNFEQVTASFRRSFDRWTSRKKRNRHCQQDQTEEEQSSATAGCLDRSRKDGLLLQPSGTSSGRRFEQLTAVPAEGPSVSTAVEDDDEQ